MTKTTNTIAGAALTFVVLVVVLLTVPAAQHAGVLLFDSAVAAPLRWLWDTVVAGAQIVIHLF